MISPSALLKALLSLGFKKQPSITAFTFNIQTVVDGVVARVPVQGGNINITSVTAVCDSGTTTLTPRVDSTNITGTPVSASSTKSTQTYSSGNTINSGHDFTLVASSTASAVNCAVTVTYTKLS